MVNMFGYRVSKKVADKTS